LAQGGNAFDAAIAVTAALAVVESSSSGIGGGGFWLLHRASDGKQVMIDGRETAPAAVDAKAYLDAEGKLDRDKSVNGALAGGIPGEPAALVHLAKHHGRLPLKRSLAPAIRLARDGFPLEERLRGMLAMRQEVMLRYPSTRAVFFPKGELLPLGSIIRQPDLAPLEAAFLKLGALVTALRGAGHVITHVDLGGGLGVPYRVGEVLPAPTEYGAMVARVTKDWGVKLIFEPGRVIAGNAGVLLTRVVRVKRGIKDPFVIVDAAMNDLARPALYGAYHHFEAVEPSGARMTANIVGPICETGDTFAMGRECDALQAGDLAVFRTAGAYGATMASSYNSRGFVAEVLVDGDRFAVVADRIEAGAIMDAERVPEWLA